MPVLTDAEVERFIEDGAVALRGAFSRKIAEECRATLWRATGCDEHDPATWSQPVIRVDFREDPPFRAAAQSPVLHEAFDLLAGVGRWSPLIGLGTFPIRFPSDEDPGDAGWHVEATGLDAAGRIVVDPSSSERVLLLLFLFSDVGEDDAPTRIRLGSHRAAARHLLGVGAPSEFFEVSGLVDELTADLPVALATGTAGDVWLCHPFLVHAGQQNNGSRVKFMAQPPLHGTGPLDPFRSEQERSAVETAISPEALTRRRL
jgi:hypothetical protein